MQFAQYLTSVIDNVINLWLKINIIRIDQVKVGVWILPLRALETRTLITSTPYSHIEYLIKLYHKQFSV